MCRRRQHGVGWAVIILVVVSGSLHAIAADPDRGLSEQKRALAEERIKNMPVTSVADILRTQVGITIRGASTHIRGTDIPELFYAFDTPPPAETWQLLDVLYHDSNGWTPGSDMDSSTPDFDLNDDGTIDLIDVVMSAETAW